MKKRPTSRDLFEWVMAHVITSGIDPQELIDDPTSLDSLIHEWRLEVDAVARIAMANPEALALPLANTVAALQDADSFEDIDAARFFSKPNKKAFCDYVMGALGDPLQLDSRIERPFAQGLWCVDAVVGKSIVCTVVIPALTQDTARAIGEEAFAALRVGETNGPYAVRLSPADPHEAAA